MASAIENLACTRRAAETTALFHCAPSAPGRATGTFPRVRQGRGHRRSRCGKQRRRRARTRSYRALRGCRWGCRCRSWQRTRLKSPGLLDAGLDGPLSRPQSLGSCRACVVVFDAPERCCSSLNDALKS